MKKVAATIKGKQPVRDLADSADMKPLGKMAGPLADPLNAGVYKEPWKRACSLAIRPDRVFPESVLERQKQALKKQTDLSVFSYNL
ncbi:hypothetical protein [Collimonas sp. PA-H2]|uniref:hypothetical protein n=1 Tax=Collimonas sp. PA-H2 TaxID=1881062 RepID=UPI0018ED4546|nr:hypothetical protein [Collimonas sp. PA-H2]